VLCARGDGGEHDLRSRDGKIWAVMFAHADEVDAELVGQDGLFDEIPNDLRLGHQAAVIGHGHVAKGVKAKLEIAHHTSEPTELVADSAKRGGLDRVEPNPLPCWRLKPA
jgi:hypothetical protein